MSITIDRPTESTLDAIADDETAEDAALADNDLAEAPEATRQPRRLLRRIVVATLIALIITTISLVTTFVHLKNAERTERISHLNQQTQIEKSKTASNDRKINLNRTSLESVTKQVEDADTKIAETKGV